MKKYKLIKEYPGSPKLGTIVELKNDGFYPINTPGGWFSEKYHLKPFPEFWEEVVEKDYEILSYKSLKKGHILFYNEKYDKNFFNNYNWIINSVKRLSDGEIFTVGDKTNAGNLTGFSIKNNKIITHHNPSGQDLNDDYYLEGLVLQKQPIFTTEDGVDIYDGDNYYWLDRSLNINNSGYTSIFMNTLNTLYFSTKEKAKEYILMNKPCLSINDIKFLDPDKYKFERLKELVKSRL